LVDLVITQDFLINQTSVQAERGMETQNENKNFNARKERERVSK